MRSEYNPRKPARAWVRGYGSTNGRGSSGCSNGSGRGPVGVARSEKACQFTWLLMQVSSMFLKSTDIFNI